ncbi:unnamed protein product [Lymnaea stagnalis]|uniref:Uncharacterized protein n=1 Tax=Lymnaea stagnalis TaxID=6523 RepID=A0AAV2I1V6_LYMST
MASFEISSDRSVVTTQSRCSCTAGVGHILSKYADVCSLNGVVFIKSSKTWTMKLIWACLLVTAIGFMGFHLYSLFATYFEYKKHTQIDLTFSNLQFPAVTICNANPIRKSKKSLASTDLNTVIDAIDPDRLMGLVDEWVPNYAPIPPGNYNGAPMFEDPQRVNNFFDDVGLNLNISFPWEDDSDVMEDFQGQKFKRDVEQSPTTTTANPGPTTSITRSNTTSLYRTEQLFKSLYNAEDSWTREVMGHKIQDLLIQCSFAGRACIQSDFKLTQSSTYGNCYTIQYSQYVSRRSGPSDGLEMILFLESDEYIKGISSGTGAQVVVHQQETVPFPDDEGMAIAAGTQSIISIRQVEIDRLGAPHGICTDIRDFKTKYGVKYTRLICQKTCEQIRIRENCACYEESLNEVNSLLGDALGLHSCRTKQERKCVKLMELQFGANISKLCECDSPCSEKKYEKTLTLRDWPSPSFARLIVETICKDKHGEICQRLRDKTTTDLAREFIKLNIYYEDLNYEHLSEQADYELSQFMSDIGGTIGLWIGLSVLSMFELLQLFLDLLTYVTCHQWLKRRTKHYAIHQT